MSVIVQNASLPGGHASIRIQQHHNMYGTSTCACHIICCVPYMVCLTAHGLLRSSVDINILTSLYSAMLFTAFWKKNWALHQKLHGEKWVYEQVKIVSSRKLVNRCPLASAGRNS